VTTRTSFGVYAFPQAAPYEQMRAVAQRAERVGFDSVWVADETPMAYPGVIELEAWTVLGALARDTTRIRIGTLVTPPSQRHPLLTAMAVTTVDHVSDGRVTLGMGVGGVPSDLEGVGLGGTTNAELVSRLDEQLDTIDRLLRGETVTRAGGFYPTANAVVQKPVQQPRPPILVAAQGPKAIGLAARHADIWNSIGGQPVVGDRLTRDGAVTVVRRHIEQLEEACVAVGRDPKSVCRSVLAWRAGVHESQDELEDWVGRYVELGFEEIVFFYSGDTEADARLDRFVAAERAASIG
jgi:alkanesulfonate monooxygenase SsuD/methylene tetrahydromethanopterin reductase-like flavin-dependent oxidoreductase (luciferase family)